MNKLSKVNVAISKIDIMNQKGLSQLLHNGKKIVNLCTKLASTEFRNRFKRVSISHIPSFCTEKFSEFHGLRTWTIIPEATK